MSETMIGFKGNSQDSPPRKNTNETVFKALAVSRGIARGKIVCLHGLQRQFYRIDLKSSEIENEIRRFRSAARLAGQQLKNINAQKSEISEAPGTSIFDAHLLIVEDEILLTKIENAVKSEKINAEWAVKTVMDDFIANYLNVAGGHLSERYIDFEDVSERLQNALGGDEKSIVQLEKNSIIAARDIKPSTLFELDKCRPQAIITERGGWTSHAFILARELNLPAVTGLKGILRRVRTGDEVIVDGFNGNVILHPKKETVRKFTREAAHIEEIEFAKKEPIRAPLMTLDGRAIKIRANVDLPNGYALARRNGAEGIGLYRSEFLFNRYRGFPTEQEQTEAYRKAAKTVGKSGIRIRTFDFTAEQLAEEATEKEPNPALGLRGIRLGLAHQKQFRAQLRALLRAAAEDEIDIVLPMISDVSEILQTRAILEQEKSNLKKQRIDFGNPRVGVMIEVPAAIFVIEEIAAAVDFLNLGTNDLVQYLLAVDRDNESVADWFRTLHPAVLRSIKKVVEAAEKQKIPLVICGEMAGSPIYAAILVGLGADELSMNPNSIGRVRKTIAAIAFEEAEEIAKELLGCRTSDAAERTAQNFMTKKWSHLFPPNVLSAGKK